MARRRGNRWQADALINGKRQRKSFPTQEAAELWEAQQKIGTSGLYLSDGCTSETLTQYAERMRPVLWGGASEKHIERTMFNIREAAGIVGDVPMVSFNSRHVEDLVAEYERQGITNATINRKMASLSKLFRHGYRSGVIPRMPLFPRQKESEGRVRYLELDEEAELFLWLGRYSPRSEDLAIFLVDTGARLGEALKLRGGDVNFARKQVTFWQTKSGKPRTVYLTQRAIDAIKRAPDPKKPFGDISRWTFREHWNKAKDRAGLGDDPQVVPHVLRHTCASRLVQGGVDFRRVQTWMGHKTMQMTMRYAHLAPDDLEQCIGVLER